MLTPHETYAEMCKRVPWAYADSWYEECEYCGEVELVLPSLERPGILVCEGCLCDYLDCY